MRCLSYPTLPSAHMGLYPLSRAFGSALQPVFSPISKSHSPAQTLSDLMPGFLVSWLRVLFPDHAELQPATLNKA